MLKSWKFWLVAIVIIIAVGGLIAYLMYNKPHPDYVKMEAVHELEATELYEQFKTDAATSHAKYGGQVILVSGKLHSLEDLDTTRVAVFVIEEGMFGDQGVRCTFHPDHITSLHGINPGTMVNIKGYCTGYNETDVILEKCVLVE